MHGEDLRAGCASKWRALSSYPLFDTHNGGGKVRSALDVIEGVDRAARSLIEVTRKRPGACWRDDFTARFGSVNGLPGVIVDAPGGTVQTTAFEIEGDVIRALYVVRNPDKLRHLARCAIGERSMTSMQNEKPHRNRPHTTQALIAREVSAGSKSNSPRRRIRSTIDATWPLRSKEAGAPYEQPT